MVILVDGSTPLSSSARPRQAAASGWTAPSSWTAPRVHFGRAMSRRKPGSANVPRVRQAGASVRARGVPMKRRHAGSIAHFG